jgi:membrane protein insertase Oxa1/YidC/SpoIIIJ|tara:strand:+ start:94 stop:372 length:279 start_codon:yes stop_codon:yes gene_type:complete
MLLTAISTFCSLGGPWIAPFIAPLINPLSWLVVFILCMAIYNGDNHWLSKRNGKKSYRQSALMAFRINYVFCVLILFFALKGSCGIKNNIGF